MTHRLTRRRLFAAGASALLAPAWTAAPASAQAPRRWRCVTSWLRNMPGPGVSARRLAERIALMSNGSLLIDVFGAGEIVPAFQVMDAVGQGSVEMGHTAAIFWGGKLPAAPLFTTQPFGFTPLEHTAWLAADGQALWDELYAPAGVKPFVAGNTGPSSSGWFRKEIRSLADIAGLRIRVTGLGGEVYAALGATPLAIPPGDTYAALERGVIDAVELLAPANDLPLGLHKVAPFAMFPGFNKPNGASEALINLAAWRALPPHLQAIVEAACRAEHDLARAEAFTANARALDTLAQQGARITALPPDVLDAARRAAATVVQRVAQGGGLAQRIVESQQAALRTAASWRAIGG
jgi:TRAP-type mannitol/chloroaromatic compound transport system substrate-binding protein